MQAVVATSTNSPTTTSRPTIVTSSKTTQNIQTNKQLTTGPPKKILDKGKIKPVGKGKKGPVKTTNATTGSSTTLHSQFKDKAKHTTALIQEITKELQAIEEESATEEHDSDAT